MLFYLFLLNMGRKKNHHIKLLIFIFLSGRNGCFYTLSLLCILEILFFTVQALMCLVLAAECEKLRRMKSQLNIKRLYDSFGGGSGGPGSFCRWVKTVPMW